MKLDLIKSNLEQQKIFYSQDQLQGKPSVIGYEKKFRWAWMATQLNTFIAVSDYGNEKITVKHIEDHLNESFNYAKKNYKGWPKGLQSGMGVISVLVGSEMDADAVTYCKELKSGKKWAAFAIPVIVNSSKNETYSFLSYPMWGRIYYPHFRKLIDGLY